MSSSGAAHLGPKWSREREAAPRRRSQPSRREVGGWGEYIFAIARNFSSTQIASKSAQISTSNTTLPKSRKQVARHSDPSQHAARGRRGWRREACRGWRRWRLVPRCGGRELQVAGLAGERQGSAPAGRRTRLARSFRMRTGAGARGGDGAGRDHGNGWLEIISKRRRRQCKNWVRKWLQGRCMASMLQSRAC